MIAGKAGRSHLVPVLRAFLLHHREAVTDLHPFHRVDAHHGVGDVGVEAIEHRLTEAHRHIAGDDLHLGTDTVSLFLEGTHVFIQRLQLARIGEEEGVLLDLALVEPFRLDGAELGEKTHDLDAVHLFQVLLGDGPRRDPHGGLAGRGAAAATVVTLAVLLVIGVVGVAGSEQILDLGVVLGALIGVLDEQPDGGARGLALEHPGEDLHLVRLAALSGVAGRTGLAPVQIPLQIVFAYLQPRRAAVDHGAQRQTVALAESGDPKELAETVPCHECSLLLSSCKWRNGPGTARALRGSSQRRRGRRFRTRPR